MAFIFKRLGSFRRPYGVQSPESDDNYFSTVTNSPPNFEDINLADKSYISTHDIDRSDITSRDIDFTDRDYKDLGCREVESLQGVLAGSPAYIEGAISGGCTFDGGVQHACLFDIAADADDPCSSVFFVSRRESVSSTVSSSGSELGIARGPQESNATGGVSAAGLRKQNISLQEQNNALALKNDILMDMVVALKADLAARDKEIQMLNS